MRRTFLKYAFGCLGTAPTLSALAASAPNPATRFSALEEASLPSGKALAAAFFGLARAGQRLVCVGERGIIILSDDAGGTWRQAKVPVSVTLTSVQFVDERNGWCTGHLGVVLHTSDAGATWEMQLSGLRLAKIVTDFASAPSSPLDQTARETLATQARTLSSDGPDKPFFEISFDNDHEGLVLGAYNLAFRTTDKGANWVPWMNNVDNPKGLHLYAAQKRGDKLYVVGEQGLLLRRTGDGARLAALPSPYNGTFFGVVVSGAGTVVAFGLRGKAFVSRDDAATWHEAVTGVNSSITSGLALADGRLLLATQAGDVLLSADDGQTFQRQVVKEPIPFTSLIEGSRGQVFATSLRGVRRLGPF